MKRTVILGAAALVMVAATSSVIHHVWASGPATLEIDSYATYETTNTLKHPTGLLINPADPNNQLFIADTGHNRIVRFESGTVFTVAGNGTAGYADGTTAGSEFNMPTGLSGPGFYSIYNARMGGTAWNVINLTVYDSKNNALRQVCKAYAGEYPSGGFGCFSTDGVTTVAGGSGSGFQDGSGSAAKVSSAISAGTVSSSNSAGQYFADTGNNAVRQYQIAASGSTGTVSSPSNNTLPGLVNGALSQARFSAPASITGDNAGTFYVMDTGNYVIRKIDTNK